MLQILFPRKYIASIFDLQKPAFLRALQKRNITLLLFDIDNTLAPYYEKQADPKIMELLNLLKREGFTVGLLSNGKKTRVEAFNQNINVLAYHRAGKPGTKGLKKAMKALKKKKGETAVIGDQIFTDVLCANRAGAYSILVKQMSEKDEWITWIKRGLEKKVMALYHKTKAEKRKRP